MDGTRWGKEGRAEFSWAAGRVGANHEVSAEHSKYRSHSSTVSGGFLEGWYINYVTVQL